MNVGEGILIVWADIPSEIKDDYNAWAEGSNPAQQPRDPDG